MAKLEFRSVTVFSEQPERLKEFYKKMFERDPDMDEGGYFGFALGDGYIGFGLHDKVKGENRNPERIMLNLETEDVQGVFRRMVAAGAKIIAEPYQMGEPVAWIATLADPDGNYFQLMTPWKGGKEGK